MKMTKYERSLYVEVTRKLVDELQHDINELKDECQREWSGWDELAYKIIDLNDGNFDWALNDQQSNVQYNQRLRIDNLSVYDHYDIDDYEKLSYSYINIPDYKYEIKNGDYSLDTQDELKDLYDEMLDQYDDLEVLLERFKDFTVWLHHEIKYLSELEDEDDDEEE